MPKVKIANDAKYHIFPNGNTIILEPKRDELGNEIDRQTAYWKMYYKKQAEEYRKHRPMC